MKLFRLAFYLGGAALLAVSLGACLKAPDYSMTPEIGFNAIRLSRSYPKDAQGQPDPKGQPTDTIAITINYQDGDGDLGLNQTELKEAKYSSSFNYLAQPFIKNPSTRKYEPVPSLNPTKPFTDNGNFDHPTTLTDTKAAPIKGTLKRNFFYNYGDVFVAGQIVKFQISIFDRKLNQSNVIMTDSVVIPPR